MKAKSVVIDQSLVAEDFLFATNRDRALYLGKLVRDRPQWLKDNPGAWKRIQDLEREAALLRRRVESPVGPIAAGPSSHMSSPDVRNDGKDADDAGSVDIPAGDPSPPHLPALAMMLPATAAAPSASGVENEIAIGTRRYVSAQRLASMLGISLRTLSRRCAAGKGPSKIKIGSKAYFELG